MKKNYQIIYLNGPSSSGKTTIARALQDKLQDPFLIFGIDQIIFMMPPKLNDWYDLIKTPGFSLQAVKNDLGNIIGYTTYAGPYGQQMIKTLKDVVVALVRAGNNVIIDDVSLGKQEVDAWRAALQDFKVLWVGITAAIEILEEREKERKDRQQGLSRFQAERVHVGVNYDVMVDTSHTSIEENVALITRYLK